MISKVVRAAGTNISDSVSVHVWDRDRIPGPHEAEQALQFDHSDHDGSGFLYRDYQFQPFRFKNHFRKNPGPCTKVIRRISPVVGRCVYTSFHIIDDKVFLGSISDHSDVSDFSIAVNKSSFSIEVIYGGPKLFVCATPRGINWITCIGHEIPDCVTDVFTSPISMSDSIFRFRVDDFVLLATCRGTIFDSPTFHVVHPLNDRRKIWLRFDNWAEAS